MCPSSGEINVSVRHLVFVTLCWRLSGLPQTRQSSTQSDKYQVSHRYRYFSWGWAHSYPKHVEKRNILRKIVHQVGFIYKIIQSRSVCTVTRSRATRPRTPLSTPSRGKIPPPLSKAPRPAFESTQPQNWKGEGPVLRFLLKIRLKEIDSRRSVEGLHRQHVHWLTAMRLRGTLK